MPAVVVAEVELLDGLAMFLTVATAPMMPIWRRCLLLDDPDPRDICFRMTMWMSSRRTEPWAGVE